MLSVRVSDLARLLDGAPKIFVWAEAQLPEAGQIFEFVEFWRLRRQKPGSFLVVPPETEDLDPKVDWVAVSVPPTSCLACILPTGRTIGRFRDWWSMQDSVGPLPEFIVFSSWETVWPGIAASLAKRLVCARRHGADLLAAMTALRLEAEHGRQVLQELNGALSVHPPTPPEFVSEVLPVSGAMHRSARGKDGRHHLRLRQLLSAQVHHVCAIDLHVADGPRMLPGDLCARLIAVESGRVLAAWKRPGFGLQPGWLRLDLPQPIPVIRESGILEVVISSEDCWALSAGPADPTGRFNARGLDGTGTRRSLAHRVLEAPFGRRYLLPQGFDWAAVDKLSEPAGAALALPDNWLSAGLPQDGDGCWKEDPATGRLTTYLTVGDETVTRAGQLVLATGETLTITVLALLPIPDAIEVAAFLVPTDGDPDDPAVFAHWLSEGVRTDWKSPVDLAQTRLVLSNPHTAALECALLLAARWPGQEKGTSAEAVAVLDWQAAVVSSNADGLISTVLQPKRWPRQDAKSSACRVETTEFQAFPPLPSELLPTSLKRQPANLLFSRAAITEFREVGTTYKHIGILLEDAQFERRHWTALRFKLVNKADAMSLEFRRRPPETCPFSELPGNEEDRYGRLWRFELGTDVAFSGLAGGDVRLLEQLVSALPRLLARVRTPNDLRDLNIPTWIDRIRDYCSDGTVASLSANMDQELVQR